jgi:hypothetical protein
LHHLLLDLGSGCAFEKPANEGHPQSIANAPPQYLPYADNDKEKSEESARAGGDECSLPKVLRNSPNDGPKNSPTI